MLRKSAIIKIALRVIISFMICVGASVGANTNTKEITLSDALSSRAQKAGWSVHYDVGTDITIADSFANNSVPSNMYFPQAAKRLVSQINQRTHEQVIVVSCKENKSIIVTTIKKGVEDHRREILTCNDDFLLDI